jgi:5-(carboxyamino)imidazole ribonucleotide mutase
MTESIKNRVVIVAGSGSDKAHVDKIIAASTNLGLTVVARVASAHKTAEHAIAVVQQYDNDGVPTVFITVAGRSNALSGFVDGYVTAPVIACPPYSDAFGGADLFSSIRMPSDVAPLLVLEPANAALAAAKIFGLTDPVVRARVQEHKATEAGKVTAADTEWFGA